MRGFGEVGAAGAVSDWLGTASVAGLVAALGAGFAVVFAVVFTAALGVAFAEVDLRACDGVRFERDPVEACEDVDFFRHTDLLPVRIMLSSYIDSVFRQLRAAIPCAQALQATRSRL